MNDLGHCQMNTDISEFMDFYDFKSENERLIKKYFLNGKFKNFNLKPEDLKDFEIVEIQDSH